MCLLSFAQFEREVIGERVRDKIAASKRKGIWVGGPIPLGYRSVGKKLEIVPEEAALVRKIFDDYLRLGSIGELAASLEGEGIRPKPRMLANGTTIAAPRFMVGPLAHLLKNRFYIGEVVYRGEIHKGEHAPILERELFDAVQAKLAERAVRRKMRRSRSPSLLTGLIFDDRNNPMSPSHANKKGVRYRYYVSQALLQNRKSEAGSVSRVSGPDIEEIVIEALREAIVDRNVAVENHDGDRRSDVSEKDKTTAKTISSTVTAASPDSDRDLIARCVERIVLRPRAIEITLNDNWDDQDDAPPAAAGVEQQSTDHADGRASRSNNDTTETERCGSNVEPSIGSADAKRSISIPWSPKVARRRKGVVHEPGRQNIDPRDRDTLLTAIAKARSWMDDLIEQRVQSFEEIAQHEQKVVRHIRFLAPLAFLSPRIVDAIANGNVPSGVTVSGLVRSLPHNWSEQERRLRSALNFSDAPTSRSIPKVKPQINSARLRSFELLIGAAMSAASHCEPSLRSMRTGLMVWRSKNPGDLKMPVRDWASKPPWKLRQHAPWGAQNSFRQRKPLTLRPFQENGRKSLHGRNVWLTTQSSANWSPRSNSLLTGKITGNFTETAPQDDVGDCCRPRKIKVRCGNSLS